jgi:prepilin-type N-terminal cleavage/methylation domain-containing protein
MKNFITKRAFTLVEILVVLVIMGFLAAMVAPRLAGMVTVAQEPIDTTSQKELSKVIQNFIIQKERLPRGLVNLVHEKLR